MDLLSVNGMDELSVNFGPQDIHGLNKISVSVRPCDSKYFRDVTSESGIHGLNGLNGLVP